MENESILLKDFTKIDDKWLDEHPDIKLIGSPTTGDDHIDLESLARRGVKFVSLKGERKFLDKISSTSEHAFGLIISVMRGYQYAFQGKGMRPRGHKLAGKTLGIIGVDGRIGTQVKRIAKGFGMKVIGYDINPRYWGLLNNNLDKLLKESDVVTVHIPLHGNEGFLDYSHFSRMKPSAYFINTSRTGIVKKGHLLQALKDGKIRGIATDFSDDPDIVKHAENTSGILLTDHLGGHTIEDRALTDEFITRKLEKNVRGELSLLRKIIQKFSLK